MKVTLQKVLLNSKDSYGEEFEFFKQFNVCDTVDYRKFICAQYDDCENGVFDNRNFKILKLENTNPSIKILSMKIIDTMEGTSLEGQYLTGKKLIISGTIDFSVVITFINFYNKEVSKIISVNMPFSTFIVVPKDICGNQKIRLKYIIEDISLMELSHCKLFISATTFIAYLDEY